MIHPRRLLGFVATWVLVTVCAAQPLTPREIAEIDALVTQSISTGATPSASIAIVRGRQLVFAKAYGKQSETIAVPRANAPYQIASNSKQFAAAAVLLLQADGKLTLDDPVAKYLPDITGSDRITIRQLLSHTSGLQDYWPQDYSFRAMETAVTPEEIVDRWAKKPLDFAPGTQWQYSNTGYVVAGMIVEKVSGQSLLGFLQSRIFAPLGMTAFDQDLAVGDGFPQGYERAALGPVRLAMPPGRGWLFAAGELSMSASDLAKWDIARLQRSILSPADWEAQETPVKLLDGSSTDYGLGVAVKSDDGRRVIRHTGEAVGFLSYNAVYPENQSAIVVLTNTWSGNAYRVIAGGIAKIILPPPPSAVPTPADAAATARALALFNQLATGAVDRATLTENANYYFTAARLADYQASLAPLGAPDRFVMAGKPELRGGFVYRSYRAHFSGRSLDISTFAEPGDPGRIEQFLVALSEE